MKLYDIVIVQRDGYRHFGEILSRRTPDFTYMVRMVPGHPSTLLEMPAAKLTVAPRPLPKWVHYAEVDGRGSFPVDMLRYDFAAPLNFDPDTKAIDASFGFKGMVVCKADNRGHAHWTPARWSSFLWGIRELRTLPLNQPGHTE